MFAHHNPHIMDIRGESVNMLALLRAVPKIHLGAVAYLEAYIDFVKPKLILSRTDNNPTLWQLKRRPNSTYKVALIQNGWRLDLEFEMPMLLGSAGRHNQWFVDQVFAYGPTWPAQIARTTRANSVAAGSLICNSISWEALIGQSQTIALVSPFRAKFLETKVDFGEVLYSRLNKYLTQSSRKLLVIGFSGPDGILEESRFIKKHLTTVDWSIESRENRMSSYENLRRVDVVLVDQSSLGYEMLGVGKRVGFIAANSWTRQTHRFGKPLEFGEKGPFWTNDPSEEEIGRILDYLLTVSDEQWERDSGWIRDQLMVHDYGNTKIRAYVEGVLTGSLKSN
jgi:surface carbohydrate biosynthesis protein